MQIIQIEPSSQYGRFFAWVSVQGVMRKIPINVPRVFYLNSKAPVTEDFPGRRVNKILPHGHHNYNLIEVHHLSFSPERIKLTCINPFSLCLLLNDLLGYN